MAKVDSARLAGFAHQLDLDLARMAGELEGRDERRLYTYLAAYPHLVKTVAGFRRIGLQEFMATKAMAYGFMPTAMNLRKGDVEALLGPLDALRGTGRRLDAAELARLKTIVNNSVSGASKVLHLVRPDIYPIWDSRIDRFLHGGGGSANSIEKYVSYLADFDRVSAEPDFEPLRASVAARLGYDVTAARAFELIMYMADAGGLVFVAPPARASPPRPVRADVPPAAAAALPRYKRDAYTFISNLGPETLDPDRPDTLLRDGYLLSEQYTTSTTLKLAALARARRNLLISDNGNWTRMSRIARRFGDAGAALVAQAEAEADAAGVSAHTRQARQALIAEVATACAAELGQQDKSAVIATQLSMNPDYMIGLEDFTVPVLMMTGLMHPVFAPEGAEIAPFQQSTRALYQQQRAGAFGFRQELSEKAVFMVVHAIDYASAKAGAEAARGMPKDGLAISYGAPMASRRWIDRIALGAVTEEFGRRLPESYIVAHALTLGVINGHPDDVPIHILGVGTPVLVMMLGFLLKHSRAVSIDSSAPMLDAFEGKIYGTKHAFLKMRMYKLAALSLIENTPYRSDTPFFREFETRHPSDWGRLRAELGVTSATDPGTLADLLEVEQGLVRRDIPFFTRLRSSEDPFFWDLRVSRSGHNYWVLRKIVDQVRRRRDDWPALRAWTEREVERYAAVGAPAWAAAVRASFDMTVAHKMLRGVE